MKTKVIYHKNCHDGATAAAVFYLKCRDEFEYIAQGYHDWVPEIADDDFIYLVDFCFQPEVIEGLLDRGVKVLVLDHHKSAIDKIAHLKDRLEPGSILDVERSGAGIAWDYWYSPETRPWLIKWVEDRDLWRYQYEDTQALYCYMQTIKYDFKEIAALIQFMNDDYYQDSIIQQGKSMQKMYDILVEKFAENDLGKVSFYEGCPEMPYFNLPPEFGSNVCNKFLDDNPEVNMVAYFYFTTGRKIWGLRSRTGHTVNDIAEKMGGGGHPQAAGFDVRI